MKTINERIRVAAGLLNLTLVDGREEGPELYQDKVLVPDGCLVGEPVEREFERRRLQQEGNDKLCAALNRFHDEHGSFAADHSTL